MKIYVDTLNSRIDTDNPDLLKALCELYAFKEPGSEYSMAYKRRHWDGKIRFISNTGLFKTGLLPRILEDLKKINCIPEIIYEDNSKSISFDHLEFSFDKFKYYDYQEKLIRTGLEQHRAIIKSPTGSGKTLIMAGLIKALRGRKMVILFNAKQLLTQTYKFLTESCSIKDIGLCFGEGYVYGDIMLCTIQSIDRILDTHLESAEVLMIDECHEFANGKQTLAAIRSFPNAAYRFGFTATPPSDNIPRYNLEGALGKVIQVVDTANLIEAGTLTKPIIQIINRSYSASGADEDMSFQDVYETFVVNNESRNKIIADIVNGIKSKNPKARILILTKSLDHGRTLEKLVGGNVQFLEGCTSISDRYNAISKFRGCEESSIIIGTKILQTGVNIEEITHFINARGLKSEIATLQALGRALRKHESKSVVYVYDFLDKEKYLLQHSKSRKRHYEREGHTVRIL
jgi:superfamily II DNA or RNA helicase